MDGSHWKRIMERNGKVGENVNEWESKRKTEVHGKVTEENGKESKRRKDNRKRERESRGGVAGIDGRRVDGNR